MVNVKDVRKLSWIYEFKHLSLVRLGLLRPTGFHYDAEEEFSKTYEDIISKQYFFFQQKLNGLIVMTVLAYVKVD